ncbi:MAG: amino acid permease [Spirochaetes bacterium]|nr:amino acid permease [Spirochaetota bacterium]
MNPNPYRFGLVTALAIIVANMVGTGVFTSLGFQVLGIQSGFWLLMLWLVGGVAALLGALCYAELGTLFPRSGGEYTYLSRIYHPGVGFLSGWTSVTVGFAGPVAATALLTGDYLNTLLHKSFPGFDSRIFATGLVVLLTLLHAWNKKAGGGFQNVFTAAKVLFILAFVLVGLFAAHTGTALFEPTAQFFTDGKLRSEFVGSLFWVAYAYMGWNAAAYIAGELENPGKTLPRALILGTVIVTALYLGLNFVFLKVAPIKDLMVQFGANGPTNTDTGHVAASFMFGSAGGVIVSLAIAILLVSSTSSMVLAGPRVIHAMGEDFSLLGIFAKTTTGGTPAIAITTQAILSIILIWFSSIQQIVMTLGLLLTFFNILAILGVIIMRIRAPGAQRPYRTPFYPLTPILFLAFGVFLVVFAVKNAGDAKMASILKASAVILGSGAVFYFLSAGFNKKAR